MFPEVLLAGRERRMKKISTLFSLALVVLLFAGCGTVSGGS